MNELASTHHNITSFEKLSKIELFGWTIFTDAKVLWALLEERVNDLLGLGFLDSQWGRSNFLADGLLLETGLKCKHTGYFIRTYVSCWFNALAALILIKR